MSSTTERKDPTTLTGPQTVILHGAERRYIYKECTMVALHGDGIIQFYAGVEMVITNLPFVIRGKANRR